MSAPPPPSESRASRIEQSIRRASPDLRPDDGGFRAARVLLAARELGANVDRVARAVREDRTYAAKCLRRLVDQAIVNGSTVTAPWVQREDAAESTAFWLDVEVAQGSRWRLGADGEPLRWGRVGCDDADWVLSPGSAEPVRVEQRSKQPPRGALSEDEGAVWLG